jgi:hypothetical protein
MMFSGMINSLVSTGQASVRHECGRNLITKIDASKIVKRYECVIKWVSSVISIV